MREKKTQVNHIVLYVMQDYLMTPTVVAATLYGIKEPTFQAQQQRNRKMEWNKSHFSHFYQVRFLHNALDWWSLFSLDLFFSSFSIRRKFNSIFQGFFF